MNRSLVQFLGETMSSLIHIMDSKTGKSFWMLLRRPGALTLAYLSGERVPYLHPFRVFLVANVLFFLLVSFTGHSPLTTKLATHTSASNFFHQEMADRMVKAHLNTHALAYEAYEASFNQRVDTLSKTLVFLMIPAFALMLGLVTIRKREYAIKHLAFSCHAYAHLLLYNFMVATGLLIVLAKPLQTYFSPDLWETISSVMSLLVMCIFIFFGLRRGYKSGKLFSLLVSVLLGMSVYAILLLYRAVLFFVTFYSLSV